MLLETTLQRYLPTLLLAVVAISGCDDPEASDPQALDANADESDRGNLGKADAPGSCFDVNDAPICDGPGLGHCWCDDACVDYGDCCADLAEACECVPLRCEELSQACGELDDGCGGTLDCGTCCDDNVITITGIATDTRTSIGYPFTLTAAGDTIGTCRDSPTTCYARYIVGEISIPDHPEYFNSFGMFDGMEWDAHRQRFSFLTYYRSDTSGEIVYAQRSGAYYDDANNFYLSLSRDTGDNEFTGLFQRRTILGYEALEFTLEGGSQQCSSGS